MRLKLTMRSAKLKRRREAPLGPSTPASSSRVDASLQPGQHNIARREREQLLASDKQNPAGPNANSSEKNFRIFCLHQWVIGRLSNKELCTLCWHATQAGASGVQDLALDPSRRGDNHARLIRSRLGLVAAHAQLYYVDVPLYCKDTARINLYVYIYIYIHIYIDVWGLAQTYGTTIFSETCTCKADLSLTIPGNLQLGT